MIEKKEVRDFYKKLRSDMTREEVVSMSERICRHLVESNLFRGADRVYAYAPLGNEVDVMPAAEEAWVSGKRVAFPKVFGDEMRFFAVKDPGQLARGTFGVMEPSEDAGAVRVDWRESRTLVLVPGVAFDRRGIRMGFGRGYYDRHFTPEAGLSGLMLIGVAYGRQVADSLPSEAHDLRLPYLVTEDGIFRTRS